MPMPDYIDRIACSRPPEGHWSPFGTVEAEVLVRRSDGLAAIVEVFEDLERWERSLWTIGDLVRERANTYGTPVRLLSSRVRWAGGDR